MSFLIKLLEIIGWAALKAWLTRNRVEKAIEQQNKDAALSDADVAERLSKWTRD